MVLPVLSIYGERLRHGQIVLWVLGQLFQVNVMLSAVFVPLPHIIVALLLLQLLKQTLYDN